MGDQMGGWPWLEGMGGQMGGLVLVIRYGCLDGAGWAWL